MRSYAAQRGATLHPAELCWSLLQFAQTCLKVVFRITAVHDLFSFFETPWQHDLRLLPLSPSPPPSDFCNDEDNCVIRSAMDVLRKLRKISLLTVTDLFLFAFFNLILYANLTYIKFFVEGFSSIHAMISYRVLWPKGISAGKIFYFKLKNLYNLFTKIGACQLHIRMIYSILLGQRLLQLWLKNLTGKNKPTLKFLILTFVCVLQTCP